MNDATTLIGRVAKLCNLVSKPQINGLFVLIKTFDVHSERYSVTTLACPTKTSTAENYKVKVQNLNFGENLSFTDWFPNAQQHTGPLPNSCTEFADHIWNIEDNTSIETSSRCLSITSSCSIRGKAQSPKLAVTTCPETRVSSGVSILCERDDCVVEFEDINFITDINNVIECRAGKHVVFRRCRFSCQGKGCLVEGQSAERSVHVLFESCHFEDCADIALRINRNGLATIINCTFVNKEDCVRVEGGRGAIIKHSSLSGAGGTGCAVKVYPKAKLLEIINCSIRLACVYLTRCKAVLVQGSCVGDTDMLFTGSVFRKAAIDDCTFSNCRDAISLIVGKASLTVTNCRFSRVQDCDFQVRQVVFGCVEISNCQRAGRLFIEEGTRCAVIIDGIPYTAPPKPKVPIPVEPGAGKAQWGKVASLRLSKKFGSERPILCFACDKVEPATVTFKLCSKCSKACYCSRECQVADWKEHKLLCGTSTSEDGDRDGHGPELDCDLLFREEMTEKIT